MYNTLLKLYYLTFSFFIGAVFALKLETILRQEVGFAPLVAVAVLLLFGSVIGQFVFRFITALRIKLMLQLPPCKNNRCTVIGRDYTWSPLTLFGWVEFGHYHYRCACGDQYMRIGNRFLELTFQRDVDQDMNISKPPVVTNDVHLKYYKILTRNRKWVYEDRATNYEAEYFGGKFVIFPMLTRGIILSLAEWGAWVKVGTKAEVLYGVLKSHSGEPYVDLIMSELTKLNSGSVKGVIMPKSRLVAYFMLDETDRREQNAEFFEGASRLKEHIEPASDTSFFVFPVSAENKNTLSVVDGNYANYFGTVLHPG